MTDQVPIINLTKMSQSRLSQRSNLSTFNLPKKQQWSIIYQHRAMELEKAKSLQKLISQQKKQNFKRQLDQQLSHKQSAGQAEREEDKRYYDFITKKAQEMKEKQERQRFEKYVQRKRIEQDNQRVLMGISNPKLEDYGKVYNIQIGLKSQIQKKKRDQIIKKDVVITLDQQNQYKAQEKMIQREKQLEEYRKNQQYQDKYHSNRLDNNKQYGQNPAIYNYYRDLYNQKMRRDKELQHKFVDEVQMKKEEEANRKKYQESNEKQRKSLQMRDTLQRQVQLLNHRKMQEKNINPQQINYSFIGNMFRQKKPAYDKRQYSMILERQAQEQRLSKIQRNYMSDEEYKLNSNQLNKALNGNYTYDKYHDRSMGALGDKMMINSVNPLQTEDAQLVKTKLEVLRNRRNRSVTNSSNDVSAFI